MNFDDGKMETEDYTCDSNNYPELLFKNHLLIGMFINGGFLKLKEHQIVLFVAKFTSSDTLYSIKIENIDKKGGILQFMPPK